MLLICGCNLNQANGLTIFNEVIDLVISNQQQQKEIVSLVSKLTTRYLF